MYLELVNNVIYRENNIQTQISTYYMYMYMHTQRQSCGPFLKIDDAHSIL